MPALYDCDGKSDLAGYEPATARLKRLLSTGAWNTTITHQLDADPAPVGIAPARPPSAA